MAITYKGERQGGAERSNGKLTRFRTLLYHVTLGSNPGDILLDENIPADGSPLSGYGGYYCIGISAPQKDSGTETEGSFTVQANYSSNAADIPVQKDNTSKPPWEQKAYNVSFPGGKDIVVPMYKGYKSGDSQFNPTEPVIHPATKEPLIADMIESHGIISFNYAVKSWNYNWQRLYRNTANKNAVTIIGYNFPAYTLLLTRLGASLKTYTDATGRTSNYWEISVEFEDFGKEIKKELALQGYYCISGGKPHQIQFKENATTGGEYGWFEVNASLNISTPRWVDKNGVVLPAAGTPGNDHYKTFYDIFRQDWSPLGLPKEAV